MLINAVVLQEAKDSFEIENIIITKQDKLYKALVSKRKQSAQDSKIEFVIEKLEVERKVASRYLKPLEVIGVLNPKK